MINALPYTLLTLNQRTPILLDAIVPRLELRSPEPKSDVLPLHHTIKTTATLISLGKPHSSC